MIQCDWFFTLLFLVLDEAAAQQLRDEEAGRKLADDFVCTTRSRQATIAAAKKKLDAAKGKVTPKKRQDVGALKRRAGTKKPDASPVLPGVSKMSVTKNDEPLPKCE